MELFEAFDLIRDTIDGLRGVVDKAQHEVGKSGPPIGSPPDKPSAVGDWVYSEGWTKPRKVLGGRSDTIIVLCDGTPYLIRDVHIVRRSTDPLQKGDKVMFGSKEGWIVYDKADPFFDRPYKVNFEENTNYFVEKQTHGWFHRKDLTLIEPVYESKED